MKIKNIMLSIFIVFLLLSCEHVKSPSTSGAINDSQVNVQINMYDLFDDMPYPISGANLILDDSSYTSDENGIIKTYFITIGEKPIKAEHDQYFTLDTLISISDTTKVVNLILEPKLYDYFPLDLNRRTIRLSQ